MALAAGDMIIIAVVLLAALAGLAVLAWPKPGLTAGLYAEIYMEGELRQTVALAEGQRELRLETAAGYNLLQVGPEGIRMLEADCPNQDCVRAGAQNRPGGVLACLPHQLLIRLSGQGEGAFDAVAY